MPSSILLSAQSKPVAGRSLSSVVMPSMTPAQSSSPCHALLSKPGGVCIRAKSYCGPARVD